MASEEEKAQLKEMITSFYKYAEVSITWNLNINEQVAEVFGIMIKETTKCSNAFGWVPKPPGGRASIFWLITQLGRGVFNHYLSHISWVCARGVIYQWREQLQLASMGLFAGRLPKCP